MVSSTTELRMMVYASLMAALTAVGAFVSIPIGPVPIVLSIFFVLLTGLLLGPRWGFVAIGVYLLIGACGLPVFSGGTGGIGRFVGPTGGYLLGYLPGVYITGVISKRGKGRMIYDIAAMVCAMAVVYACGIGWLKALTGMTWSKALAVGMYPFFLGDALKIAVAAPVARILRPILHKK